MDNLINIFMNYKIQRLVKYSVLVYNKDSEFINNCFTQYFSTYVDNYYYGIFNTIDDDKYTRKNLELEFTGIMEEMLEEYRVYELQVSNLEYAVNRKDIIDTRDIALEIVKLDTIKYNDKDDISLKVNEFVQDNDIIKDLLKNKVNKLVSLVKETYVTTNKLLDIEDNYFNIKINKFKNNEYVYFYSLDNSIKVLNTYRDNLVKKVFENEKLNMKKLECLINKVSLYILKNVIDGKKINKIIIEINDNIISRGYLDRKMLALIDNPLIRKYVVLGVNYNTYLNHKNAFEVDFDLACIQDFTFINDIYSKVDNIYNEGIFNYIVVSGCKEKDSNFFLENDKDNINILVFEEE